MSSETSFEFEFWMKGSKPEIFGLQTDSNGEMSITPKIAGGLWALVVKVITLIGNWAAGKILEKAWKRVEEKYLAADTNFDRNNVERVVITCIDKSNKRTNKEFPAADTAGMENFITNCQNIPSTQ